MAFSTNQFQPGGVQDLCGLGQMSQQQAISRRDYEMEMMRRQYMNMAPQGNSQEAKAEKKPQPKVNKTILLLEI